MHKAHMNQAWWSTSVIPGTWKVEEDRFEVSKFKITLGYMMPRLKIPGSPFPNPYSGHVVSARGPVVSLGVSLLRSTWDSHPFPNPGKKQEKMSLASGHTGRQGWRQDLPGRSVRVWTQHQLLRPPDHPSLEHRVHPTPRTYFQRALSGSCCSMPVSSRSEV